MVFFFESDYLPLWPGPGLGSVGKVTRQTPGKFFIISSQKWPKIMIFGSDWPDVWLYQDSEGGGVGSDDWPEKSD